ncbi:collagen alpha-2(I) chain-like [Clytia hemisphaerica]|uniref:collagen alpha-2(I) chain-like n=1 Tax=Clytia hemisphaerica TaxID=252671 RepID=UPI0034D66DA1
MKSVAIFLVICLTIRQIECGSEPGPPGPPGPPGMPAAPAPCTGECVGLGCEPACLVGCCGYHGRYGKSGKWIRSVLEKYVDEED